MKKILILIVIAITSFLCSCGGNAKDEKTNQDSIPASLKEVQQQTTDIKAKSDELNQKADSILNNL